LETTSMTFYHWRHRFNLHITKRRSEVLKNWWLKLKAISWSNKKQPIVAPSSTKSEFMSTFQPTMEIMWLKTFLVELGFHYNEPMPILTNNQKIFPSLRIQSIVVVWIILTYATIMLENWLTQIKSCLSIATLMK